MPAMIEEKSAPRLLAGMPENPRIALPGVSPEGWQGHLQQNRLLAAAGREPPPSQS